MADIVLIHALRGGLDPGADVEQAATELVVLARGDRVVLEGTRRRLDLVLSERNSRVGRRARAAVLEALDALPA